MAVTGLEIRSRRLADGGRSFGEVGPYEQVLGTAKFAIDPHHAANRCITDIALAPRGADGLVHFSADFFLLRPANPERGNRRLLLGVPNRGRKIALGLNFVPTGPETEDGPDFGDGFVMERGYTVIECGWEWGAPSGSGQMAIDIPEATGPEGPVVGEVVLEWQPDQLRSYLNFSEGLRAESRPYLALDLDDPEASLTVRDHQLAPRHSIDRSLWRFAGAEGGRIAPNPNCIRLSTGFQAGKIYELVYRTRGAPVVGLGLLTARDIASFLRYASDKQDNPCAAGLDYAYAYGISQTGRFLRHFLYLGLNEDERERLVFDGLLIRIAGGRRGPFNQRFGILAEVTYFGAENLFPFTDEQQTDPATGNCDGLLARLRQRGKVPKIFHVNSANEYWRGDASLIHADTQGERDVAPPDDVRIYHMAGTQHGSGSLPLTNVTVRGDRTRHALNSLDYLPIVRAALINLDRWVSEGIEPPASQYPRLADGSAVPPASLEPAFSALPGVAFPQHIPTLLRLDFGPQWSEGVATVLPPDVGAPYPSLVSAVDQDGNEVAGIKLPDVTVPLATYTGWNPRHPESGGEREMLRLMGATLPFPRDAAERQATGDPRPSIAERYGTKAEYLERFRQAAQEMVVQRHLLAKDVERMVGIAALRWDLFTARA